MPTRRHLIPERLAEVGVPHGPERAKLARGEPITLADGRVISPDEVTSPPTPGTKLVVVGDVEDTTDILPHARGAAAHGIAWHYCRPPVIGLDYEMDCRALGRELAI